MILFLNLEILEFEFDKIQPEMIKDAIIFIEYKTSFDMEAMNTNILMDAITDPCLHVISETIEKLGYKRLYNYLPYKLHPLDRLYITNNYKSNDYKVIR